MNYRRDGKIIVHLFVAIVAAIGWLGATLFEPDTLRLICAVLVVGNVIGAGLTYVLSERSRFGQARRE